MKVRVFLVLLAGCVAGRPHVSHRRIVGGTTTSHTKYPWFATLTKVAGHGITCGVSLIRPTWGVTACHCIIKGDYTGYYPGQGGEITYGCDNVHGSGCVRRSIKRFVNHPCYTISCCDDHDDLCLIELNEPANVESYASLAGLDGSLALPVGSPVTLVGTGSSNHGIGVLRKVEVNTVSKAACMAQEPYAVNNRLINLDNVICTGGTTGKDSCGGDSGSPVVGCYSGRDWVLGVLVKGTQLPSSGPACGAHNRYAVYTRISLYSAFIQATINNQGYTCMACHKQGGTSCTSPAPGPPVLSCSASDSPTQAPTQAPSASPTEAPSLAPSESPTFTPSHVPTTPPPTNLGDTYKPTQAPTFAPSVSPTTAAPSSSPTSLPTSTPTVAPTIADSQLVFSFHATLVFPSIVQDQTSTTFQDCVTSAVTRLLELGPNQVMIARRETSIQLTVRTESAIRARKASDDLRTVASSGKLSSAVAQALEEADFRGNRPKGSVQVMISTVGDPEDQTSGQQSSGTSVAVYVGAAVGITTLVVGVAGLIFWGYKRYTAVRYDIVGNVDTMVTPTSEDVPVPRKVVVKSEEYDVDLDLDHGAQILESEDL